MFTRALYLCLVITLLFSCTGNNEQFVLDGTLQNVESVKKVLLYEGDKLVDSAFLDDRNKFRFRRNVSQPKFYNLTIGDNDYFLVLGSGEKVSFEADLTDNEKGYKVSGSEVSQELKYYNQLNNQFNKESRKLEEEFRAKLNQQPDSENEIRAELMPIFKANLEQYANDVIRFAKKNENNLAGFYALSSLDPAEYEEELMQYAENIRGKFQGNDAVQAFISHMAELKPLSIGHVAPDFESLDTKGKMIKLSDFRGKYTLIDFWASWCTPCRLENPNIVAQFNKYKEKDFTVLGVSLDNDQGAWKQAINDDNLDWTHVSDLDAWNSKTAELYKVTGIPTSFLIDPNGVIVAKNLRGDKLASFLESTL